TFSWATIARTASSRTRLSSPRKTCLAAVPYQHPIRPSGPSVAPGQRSSGPSASDNASEYGSRPSLRWANPGTGPGRPGEAGGAAVEAGAEVGVVGPGGERGGGRAVDHAQPTLGLDPARVGARDRVVPDHRRRARLLEGEQVPVDRAAGDAGVGMPVEIA